jgi:hypothetical protein
LFRACRKDTVFRLNRAPRHRILVLVENPMRLDEAREAC